MRHAAILMFLLLTLAGCGPSRAERAQTAADARAGVQALRAAHEAGAATSDILAMLHGIDARLPAVSGVNSADWPTPVWTVERITAAPVEYAQSAPPEPERWSFWLIAGGVGTAALAAFRLLAPMIPGGGPLISGVANMAWTLLSTRDQKATDHAAATVTQAAAVARPLLDALRALPLDRLPESVSNALSHPSIAQAIDTLATKPTAK